MSIPKHNIKSLVTDLKFNEKMIQKDQALSVKQIWNDILQNSI